MHQNKITICLGAVDENRTRLNRIDNPLPSQRTTTAYWYRVRESNPSLWLEGPRTYPEVQRDINWSGLQASNLHLSAWKAKRIPLTTRINLVLRDGLEPPSPDYKTGILAFEITEQIKQDAFFLLYQKSYRSCC
jgi:hypothetical protein